MKRAILSMLAAVALLPCAAQAQDWTLEAKVTTLEGGGVPSQVFFRIDRPAGTCATGTFLFWVANGSDADTIKRNREAVYAMLLVAKATGQNVIIVGDNNGCRVSFLYLAEMCSGARRSDQRAALAPACRRYALCWIGNVFMQTLTLKQH